MGVRATPDDAYRYARGEAIEHPLGYRVRLRGEPVFDPAQHAFYYLRILQNPTCRWSTWDAIRAGVAPSSKVPATHQERAWNSPIWISPAARNSP